MPHRSSTPARFAARHTSSLTAHLHILPKSCGAPPTSLVAPLSCSLLCCGLLEGGILPDAIGAFVDISTFSAHDNNLTGTLPLSLSAWKKMENFQVHGNQFSGGPLPALPFPTKHICSLFTSPTAPFTNQFTCPWPAGAVAACKAGQIGGAGGRFITDADCAGPCTGSSTKLALDQCRAWIAFYDATNGDKWIPRGGAAACTRTDPCSCKPSGDGTLYSVCDPTGTTVKAM